MTTPGMMYVTILALHNLVMICLRLILFCICPPLCTGVLWPMPAWVWRDVQSVFFIFFFMHASGLQPRPPLRERRLSPGRIAAATRSPRLHLQLRREPQVATSAIKRTAPSDCITKILARRTRVYALPVLPATAQHLSASYIHSLQQSICGVACSCTCLQGHEDAARRLNQPLAITGLTMTVWPRSAACASSSSLPCALLPNSQSALFYATRC